jgi:hypothetical protein
LNATDRRLAVGLFCLTFVAYAYFAGGGGWNQNAQFALTRAIVEQRTLAIDAFRDTTGDLSYHAGRTYANKAPGVSLLGVIPYALLYVSERAAGLDLNDPLLTGINLWLVTLLTCGVTGAAIPAVLFAYARRRLGIARRPALAVALIFAFATYLFAYSTVYFAHVPSALFLLLAFTLRDEKPFTAGLAAGAASLCNYLCMPAALLIFLMHRERLTQYVAGGIPFAILLGAYQLSAFGSPFTTAIDTMDPRFATEGALMGAIVPPQLSVLPAITISRFRGLFYLSPVLLMSLAGIVVMLRQRLFRRELAFAMTLVAFFVGFNLCFNGWHGGSAIGPRYILTIVPLLAIPMFFATTILRPLWIALAAISFAFNFIVTAVNPLPSKTIDDPIGSYAIPLFVTGRLPASTPPQPLWGWKVMLGHVSVNRNAADEAYPYTKHRPGSPAAEWASFNLGEFALGNTPWSVAPIVLWILGGAAVLMRRAH